MPGKIFWSVFFLVLVLQGLFGSEEVVSREKRYLLVYPRGGTFKLVIGIAVPWMVRMGQTLATGWNFQFQYPMPTNASLLHDYPPYVGRALEKRDVPLWSERALAYLGVEKIMDNHGINGRSCLLRSICENAFESLNHEANGLYGHLLHIFLTPDSGDGIVEEGLDQAYVDAQKAGAFGAECQMLYPECPEEHWIIDMITAYDDFNMQTV